MYELFPNKEVLKYNHIGLNNITNGICKTNTVDKLQRSAYACHWTCLLWFKKKYNHVTFNLNFIVYIEWTQGV